MTILNLTQHAATPEQKATGVVDLEGAERLAVIELLTFDELPSAEEIKRRAVAIAEIAASIASPEDRDFAQDKGFFDRAMIGGAPFFMGALQDELLNYGVRPVFAFSKRESVEETQPDGSIVKKAVFRHLGFVEV